jgi:hypothetical protein
MRAGTHQPAAPAAGYEQRRQQRSQGQQVHYTYRHVFAYVGPLFLPQAISGFLIGKRMLGHVMQWNASSA